MQTNTESDIPSPIKEPNPLKEEFIKNVKLHTEKKEQYKKLIKTIEHELGPINWCYNPCDDHGEPTEFNASELRDIILHERTYNILTDKHTQVVYLYTQKTGIYHKDGEQYLRYMIDRVLGDKSTTRKINETIELLKIRTYATIEVSPKIAVENGLLDITTGKLEEFNCYEFNTNKLAVEYKESAKSEAWLNFIDQVCPNDKDLLQEWSGYILVKGYPYHAIMWLYGPSGRNGKGAWSRTMQGILGEENYSSVSIDEFDGKHRFAVFNLRDSLFNICSEPRADREFSIEMLQMLTGQDSIDAERKGVQERFKFKNGAKITVMGNKFPKINNPTEAFWERLKLCKFPNQFIGENQVQDIEKSWLDDPEQRSGILNWMIEGARRLLKHGFTLTRTQEKTIIQFKRASDTVGAFIDECIEFKADEFSEKTKTYELYKEYCQEIIGIPPKSNTEFSSKLNAISKIKDTSKRLGIGKNKVKTRVWQGIKLLELPKDENDELGDEQDGTKTEDKTQNKQLTLGESGTVGTAGTASITCQKQEELKINKDNSQKPVPLVPSVPKNDSIMRFQRVNSRVESHRCDNPECENERAILAEYKQVLDAETVKELGKDALYFCPDCFNKARSNAEKDGINFVEAPMEEPTDDYPEGF